MREEHERDGIGQTIRIGKIVKTDYTRYIALGQENEHVEYFSDITRLAWHLASPVYDAQVNERATFLQNFEGIVTIRAPRSYMKHVEKLSPEEIKELSLELEARLQSISSRKVFS